MQKKDWLVTELLCMFLGSFGGHRYYTGYIGLGILQMLTMGGCGIWTLIDFICINLGKYKDARGLELEGYNKKAGRIILTLVLILLFSPFLLIPLGLLGLKSVINDNNYVSQVKVEPSYSDVSYTVIEKNDKKQVIKIGNATCTIGSGWYACKGSVSDAEKDVVRKLSKRK